MCGYKIEFKEIQFNTNYLTKCLSLETRKNVFQWRLENCWERVFDPNQFLSNQFTIPKKGDELRPVINLKPLNHFVEFLHFKMKTY